MPDVIPERVPSPRAPLVWDGTVYRAVRGHTDGTVQVRGEDQLHSFGGVLAIARQDTISGANGYSHSAAVPDDVIWHVTHIAATDRTTATTIHSYNTIHNAGITPFCYLPEALPAAQISSWDGEQWLDPGDYVQVYFIGSLAGDICRVYLYGEIMTLET